MTTSNPKIYAVILNWNDYAETASTVKVISDTEFREVEIIVVDNGSTDGSASRLREEFPDTTILQMGENKGFAGGMNEGICHALERGAEYVWLLNNDMYNPDSDLIEEMLGGFDHDGVGIVSPVINKYPNSSEIWFVRGSVGSNTYRAQQHVQLADESLIDNDYVPFCSTVISREVFNNVGLLPEEYFLYYEDVDYCTRVRQNGFSVVTMTTCKISHKVGGSSSTATNRYYHFRNRLHYVRTHGQASALFIGSYLYYLFASVIYNTAKNNFDVVIAAIYGVRDGLIDQMGKGPFP